MIDQRGECSSMAERLVVVQVTWVRLPSFTPDLMG